MNILDKLNESSLKPDPPSFEIGDTVDVHVQIVEGDKERVQVFTGTVIARKGRDVSETFTVRRIVAGQGVERVFPLHSPKVVDVKVKRNGVARRAKLYFLRDRVGKATRLKERIVRKDRSKVDTPADDAPLQANTESAEQPETKE